MSNIIGRARRSSGRNTFVAEGLAEHFQGPSRVTEPAEPASSLRQHVLQLLVAEGDFVHRVTAVLERHVVAVDVRREEDLCRMSAATLSIKTVERTGIPGEALTRGEVGDLRLSVGLSDNEVVMATYQTGWTLRIANVDNGGLLLGDGGACGVSSRSESQGDTAVVEGKGTHSKGLDDAGAASCPCPLATSTGWRRQVRRSRSLTMMGQKVGDKGKPKLRRGWRWRTTFWRCLDAGGQLTKC